MTDIIIFILYSAAFLGAAALLTMHQMHFFQLNSYKHNVQKAWIARDKDGLYRRIFTLAALPLAFFKTWGLIVGFLIFIAAILLNLPKPAKKPLVLTGRVKRMLRTLAIIYAVLIAAAAMAFFTAGFVAVTALFGALLAVNPYTVLLSDTLNKPMEEGINNGFIKDAERIIREMPRLTVIGVTGSYGKTSVKFYLGKLLSSKYNVLVTPESYNTTLGVVRTVREHLRPTHEIFVCEMGAKGVGEIKEICDIVKPDMGIITSIGPQHLESFHSIENVINTKFELEAALPEGGTIFLNTDNEYIAKREVKAKRVSYGLGESAEYRARDIKVSERGSEFKMTGRDGAEYSFTTKLIGAHNVQNIAGAIAVADALGVPMEDIVMQVRRLESVPHRLQLIRNGNSLIIDDAYNSNPSGARAALAVLKEFTGTKILITPGMVELGEKQYELNREFGAEAAEACDYVMLVGEKQTKPIYDGLIGAGFDEKRLFVAETIQEALAKADATAGERKIVLLENDLPDNY